MQPKGLWRKSKKLIKNPKTLLIILAVLAVLLCLEGDFLKIKTVSCRIDENECPPELKSPLTDYFLGKNIFLVGIRDLEKDLGEKYPWIEKQTAVKIFPDRLDFRFTNRQILAAIAGDSFALVDESGLVVKISKSSGDYPVVSLLSKVSIALGQRIDQPSLAETLQILKHLRLRLLEPKRAEIGPPGKITIWFRDGSQAVFSSENDIIRQLDSLQLILNRTKMEGKQFKKIDLRFDKPVISE